MWDHCNITAINLWKADSFFKTMAVFTTEAPFLGWKFCKRRDYNLSSRFESRSWPPSYLIPTTHPTKRRTHTHACTFRRRIIWHPDRNEMLTLKNKVAKYRAQTQTDKRRISYLDSGNYSTSSTRRQLSHLLLPLPSVIRSPDNKKQQRENPKQTAENRHLTVCLCEHRGTLGTRVRLSVSMGVCLCVCLWVSVGVCACVCVCVSG